MAEEWQPVPGFALYEVSNMGRVWSRRTERMLTGTPCKGYTNVRLTKGRKRCLRPIHRLVCQAFHGDCPPDKEMVGHLDGDPLNNRAGNLAWITRSENTLHSIAHGTFRGDPVAVIGRGERHARAKLSAVDVRDVRARLAEGETCNAIAKRFGVGQTAISKIKTGERWAVPEGSS